MRITVVGTGYVGLVAGVCFAESGHKVVCVDVDESKIAKLKSGVVPIYEPGLSELMQNNTNSGRLVFSTSLADNMPEAEIIFIAVGTPMGADGSADLHYVLEVAAEIGENLNGYKVVVDKSTVPVGTADKVKKMISSKSDMPFDVVSNPEFLKEGAAIQDFMKPDRIVIGTESRRAEELMLRLYDPFVRTGAPIYCMDVKSAEMTKYVSNAMLATKISFMNEMARLSDAVGADITKVRKAVGADSRIGTSFLFPGVGYGGSCFPKDVRAIEKTGVENGLPMSIMNAVGEVNENQKKFLNEKISAVMGDIKGCKFAIWGLSFKPQTDDMREAPSLTIINFLLSQGAQVAAYDPQAMDVTREHYFQDKIEYGAGPYDVVKDADALILVTEWNEFRVPDYIDLEKLMKGRRIFDGRNIYLRSEAEDHGFEYYGVGC
ncbi:MAG: UDP-glucose/GDP-mannose dehydrogenase family protein [Planctomycetes bacterium]|nr:UDP-glucose/GDP-mannose dehydrogenase family protein [Planctomycetota bacterium]